MKVNNQNIVMEPGKTVDGRDVSEDGKILDAATSSKIPGTLVKRNENNFADVITSNANKLTYPRKINITGSVSGSFIFDGSEDINVILSKTENIDTYTKAEINDLLTKGNHKHAILTNGEGIVPFTYDGRENVTIRTAFAGIQGDFGVEGKYVARSDHLHDKRYYTKVELDSGAAFDFELRIAGNKLLLLNKGVQLAEVLLPSLL